MLKTTSTTTTTTTTTTITPPPPPPPPPTTTTCFQSEACYKYVDVCALVRQRFDSVTSMKIIIMML